MTLKSYVKVSKEKNVTCTELTPSESECTKVIPSIFALALTVCEILLISISELENLSQSHGGEKRDLVRSIANINLYKSEGHFSLAFTVFEYSYFGIGYL